MTVTLMLEGLANYLANKLYGEVEANLDKYAMEDDIDALEWMQMVERELEKEIPFKVTEEVYDITLEALLRSDALQSVQTTIEVMIREHREDQAEWAKGEMSYYGLKNSDFA